MPRAAGSSNGRIEDSESFHLGSNPSPAAVGINGKVADQRLWRDHAASAGSESFHLGSNPSPAATHHAVHDFVKVMNLEWILIRHKDRTCP